MVDVKDKLKLSLIKYDFQPTHNNNCLVREQDEWIPICFLVHFFNNHPDNYVLAYPHEQENFPTQPRNRVVCVTVFIDCGESGVLLRWRPVASGLLARAVKQGVRTRTKAA